MAYVNKNGIFLFSIAACVATAFRWRENQATEAAAQDAVKQSNDADGDSDVGSVDSLDEYFEEDLDYDVRNDFTMEDGRFKMVLLVNMKLG